MKTLFLLMARYEGLPIIPLAKVCDDFFAPMTERVLRRQIQDGKIKMPIVFSNPSQKAARGVHINDLAAYLDERAEEARRAL